MLAPSATSNQWYTISYARLLFGTDTPVIGPSCVQISRMPTAARKPVITGSDRKRITNPSRSTPIATWTMPTSSASVAASATKRSVPACAIFATPTADRIEIDASGPTLSWRDRPSTA